MWMGTQMVFSADPRHNHLIAALPHGDWPRWRAQLTPVELAPGQVLYEAGTVVRQVYFPTQGLISKQHVTRDGGTSELAVVGREGIIGTSAFLGGGPHLHRVVALTAAQVWRMPVVALLAECRDSALVQPLLLRYTQALMTQMAQTAVCTRLHRLDQRLSRWLLMALERSDGDEVPLTHEAIAQLLGVRREGVTEAAGRLQRAGVIRYARGRIQVLDLAGLMASSCECHGVVQREYERLLWLGRSPRMAA